MEAKTKIRENLNDALNRISKEEFISYYNTGVNKEAIQLRFNLSLGILNKILNFYGLKSPKKLITKLEQNLNKISKDNLINYYIKENHTIRECAIFYSVKDSDIRNLLEYYSIVKDKELIKESYKNTCKERYGVENSSQIVGVQDKKTQTILKNYGSLENFYEVRQEKIKKTCQETYGVPYISQSKGWNDKIEKTAINRYGSLENFYEYRGKQAFKSSVSEEFKEYFFNKDKSVEFLKKKEYTISELTTIFNASHQVIYDWVLKFHLEEYIQYSTGWSSGYEKDVEALLPNNTNIIKNNRKLLGNHQEIDIYLPDYNIGIEFNGTYYHSDKFKPKNYHINKSKLAEEKGIRLIHIWEYEWKNPEIREKLKSLLKTATHQIDNKIYARKCSIREINNKEAKLFNETNHLQGHRNAQVTYGLFYQDKLVQLMSFSKTKYNKNLKDENSWEIIRSCSLLNTLIIGGAQKLFTYFIRNYNPDSIFSYCDFNKFDGKSYKNIGMKFIGYTGPDMKWVLTFNNYLGVVSRQPSKHKELKEKAEAQLWGAGSKKFLWVKK